MRKENASTHSTFLGRENHGILSCMIGLKYRGSYQGLGGYNLSPDLGRVCGDWIIGILDALKVDCWEDLKGTVVRVRIENNTPVAIGHAIEDSWFIAATATVEKV